MSLRLLIGAVLLFVQSLYFAPLSSAIPLSGPQSYLVVDTPAPSSETQNPHTTDRENAGLRGPVSVNVEEAVWGDGNKHLTTTKYSPAGKLLTHEGPFMGVPEPGGHVDVRYEQGVKTTIQTFDSKTHMQASFTYDEGFSPWDTAARGGGVPIGGNATTLYDENNQATELQIRDADGTTIYKFVRTYNANGRVTQEKMILEDPTAYFLDNLPQVKRDKMTPEQLKIHVALSSFMMRGKSQVGVFYTFDDPNQLTKIVERNRVLEKTATITYNDQGDQVEMRATFADNAALPSGVPLGIDETGTPVVIDPRAKPNPPAMIPEAYSIRYVYQYDGSGNWVQRIRIVSTDSRPDESSVLNRKLSYYQPQSDK
jgi:hypothetical protein